MRDMFLMIDILSYLRHSDGFIILFCRGSVLRTSPPAWRLSSFQDFLN